MAVPELRSRVSVTRTAGPTEGIVMGLESPFDGDPERAYVLLDSGNAGWFPIGDLTEAERA